MKKAPDHAFSLLELLVCIAIVSLLASLMFPALSAARQRSYRVLCLSNQKQLSLAAHHYWSDHQDRSFPYLLASGFQNTDYWFGRLEKGGEGERKLDRTQGALWPYVDASGLALCPSFNYRSPDYKPKALGASYGYGYNLHLAAMPGQTASAYRMDALSQPASTALFADAAQINDFQFPATSTRPLLEEFYYINDGPARYANGHFRHQQKAVASFCDGHVAMASPRENTRDERLPTVWVARLESSMLRP